jgi:glycosyltransferase involved in cell wall biosynthesis
MPVYNAEKYLPPALESILNQTYKNLEILIINDGSTDDSEKIILSYKASRIRYIKQNNQCVAKTLNNGLVICRGKYIRQHADDISTLNSQLYRITVGRNIILKK